MNKVFKVIWSEARNAYVVVSEMAKSHGTKSCSTKKLLAMLIATGVMTCASVAPVMAANLASTDTKIEIGSGASAKGSEGVAIGKNSEASESGYATAIGGDAKATGSRSTVVGNYSKATGLGTISIGYGNLSSGNNAITIGHEAIAAGMNSFAFGSEAKANEQASIAFGTKSVSNALGAIAIGNSAQALGTNSIAIGRQAIASKEYSVVIGAHTDTTGTGSNVTAVGQQTEVLGSHSTAVGMAAKANFERATAIGSYANVLAAGSVALGAGSTASREAGVQGYDPLTGDKSADTSFAWKSTKGAVSVGGVGVTRQIINVAAGSEDSDAVNVAQLKKVAVEAGKHTTLVAGDNVTLDKMETDKGLEYTVKAVDTKYTAGNGIAIDAAANNAISVNLKKGENNLVVNESGLALKSDLTGIHTISNGKSLVRLDNNGVISILNNSGAGIAMAGGITSINSIVNIDKEGHIKRVAAGEISATSRDAVNGSQLHAVATEAGKHSTVTDSDNITVTEGLNKDGGKEYNVALNNDIFLSRDNDAFVDISGSKGTIWASSSVAAGNVIMDGTTATVSGLGNTTTAYDGFANGEGKAATEEQLKEVSKVAENANQGWNLSTNGGEASKVAPGETVDFSGDKNITISNDGTNVKVKLNENIDVNSVQTNALNSKYNLSVGTMAENGIMPFFVNSTGDFYAAHNKFHVDKDGKVIATAGEIGNVVLQNGVYYGHSTLQDGSLLLTDDNGNHSYIDAKSAKLGKVTVAEDGKISGVAAGAITADSTDAVNGSQLHAVATEAGKHSKVVNGSNINVEEFDNDGQKIYKVNLNKDIMLGDLTGKYVSISGTNGTIETTGYIATKDRVYADKGAKLADIDVTGNKISNGASSIVLDGSNVKVNDKVTIDQNGKISGVAAGEISSTSTDAINGSQLHQTNENVAANRADIDKNKADIAALDNRVTKNEQDIAQNKADIAQNKADIAANRTDIDKNAADIAQNKTDIKNLDNRVTNVEELAKKHTTVTAGDNITVTEDTNKDGGKEYKVALDKDIKLDSVTTGQTVMNNDGLKVGDKVSVTATAVTAGKTSISDEGVKVGDKTYISDKGLNANDQKVTNVAAGELSTTSKDAVNGSQLYATNQEVANNTNRINKLGSRVNKVGAGAAALAALHPMDFDPDDKLTFSAGYGNYAGENAAAIGAYYRPDEKVMFSVAGTVGNGENMVNAGVSFALDRTNHVSNSRTALAREVIDLRGQLAVMGAKMAKMEKAFGMLDETKTKLFPDVPANHWAYEYIAKLAGNGYIEGYPDGNFGGDRLMTRYEFAAMLYRAIENGAALEEKIIKEFEPELGRIRVDRISGEDGDRDKIERVRVNDTKGERDHYGNKLAK